MIILYYFALGEGINSCCLPLWASPPWQWPRAGRRRGGWSWAYQRPSRLQNLKNIHFEASLFVDLTYLLPFQFPGKPFAPWWVPGPLRPLLLWGEDCGQENMDYYLTESQFWCLQGYLPSIRLFLSPVLSSSESAAPNSLCLRSVSGGGGGARKAKDILRLLDRRRDSWGGGGTCVLTNLAIFVENFIFNDAVRENESEQG